MGPQTDAAAPDMAAAPLQDPPPLQDAGRRTSSGNAERWGSAIKNVTVQLSVVNRFKALRDSAGPAFIESSRLTRVRTLGVGAFATVDLCRLDGDDGQAGGEVAVKHLKAELFHNPVDQEDFVREAVLLATLHHPSIVKVFGVGFDSTDAGRAVKPESMFMCAEVCQGGALRDVVRDQMISFSKTIYTYANGVKWAIQIAEGLAYLHAHSPMIIHRDVKLDNILLTEDGGDAKLTDFGLHAQLEAIEKSSQTKSLKEMAQNEAMDGGGIAKTPESITARSSKRSTTLRKLKSLAGRTPDYRQNDLTGQTGSFLNMAPEVVLGKQYDQMCDIFSLGVILFEIFSKSISAHDIAYTGAPEEFQIFAMRVARGYRRPHPKHWGTALSALVTDCLAQEPQDRPTASQVVERLKEVQDSGDIAAMDARASGGCCVVQ